VAKWCPEPSWLSAMPLLPDSPQRHQGGGRRRLDDRAVLAAVVYVLRTGCAWSVLPVSLGIRSPTARRRFAEWVQADASARLHRATLDLLGVAGVIDWSRASVDGMHVRAVTGGPDRPQPGRPRQTRVEDATR
jgi:transposase